MFTISTYICADLHLGHEKIIDYCQRPFNSIQEMNETLINNWNNTVTDKDIVLFLGDMAFGNKETIKPLVSQLKGQIYMIKGNHCKHFSTKFWLECGIKKILPQGYKLIIPQKDNETLRYILSHQPLADNLIPDEFINIHGHIHNVPLSNNFNTYIHRCVSMELIDYKPILLYEENIDI